jgi:Tfp pilus assembly protein PilV
MLAVLILGIALVGFVQATTTALSSSKESELQTTAALLASGRIEKLRADGEIEDGVTDGDCGDDFPNYQWKQTITATDIKGLHAIEVVVENTRSGKQVFELRTMLFEAPLTTDEDDTKTKNSTKSKKKKKKGTEE